MKELFQQSHQEILQVVRKTDQDFKAYKSCLKSLQHEKQCLEKTLEKMERNKAPKFDEDAKRKRLDAVTKRLEGMWLLEAREVIRNPKNLKEGKKNMYVFFSVPSDDQNDS